MMEATGDRMGKRSVSSPSNSTSMKDLREEIQHSLLMSSLDGTSKDVGVTPKIGRVLVFQHDILHEGSVLVRGTKYTMRTDVMYGFPEQGN